MLFLELSILVVLPAMAAVKPMAAVKKCWAIVVTAVVCVDDGASVTCSTENYLDDYWCSGSGGGSGGPSGGGGGGSGGGGLSPADADGNSYIDHWRDVVETNDPCANNFDANDRLGSNLGGTNTSRPGHNGVDIQANDGDLVAAVADGEITAAQWQRSWDHSYGCGFHIRVQHDNSDTTVYCHLQANSNGFEVGQRVRAGHVIALANSTGNSSGPHLHLNYNSSQTGGKVEYFTKTDDSPSSSELNPNGC